MIGILFLLGVVVPLLILKKEKKSIMGIVGTVVCWSRESTDKYFRSISPSK